MTCHGKRNFGLSQAMRDAIEAPPRRETLDLPEHQDDDGPGWGYIVFGTVMAAVALFVLLVAILYAAGILA